jgi:arylsulfatase A-like enzyme
MRPVTPRRESPKVLVGSLVGMAIVLFMGMSENPRPNVVVIVVDTLRADSVSVGMEQGVTPNIAALAARGTVFPQAFSHAPMTLPAHAALFSGRHPYETGVHNNGERVPEGLPLLAEHLRQAGYQTEAVVSLATLWPDRDGHGLDRGFEGFDMGRLPVAPAEDTSARLDATLERLDSDRPFFLFAHLSDPHEPYNEHAPHFAGEARAARAEILLNGSSLDVVPTSRMSNWETTLDLAPGTHSLVVQSDRPFKLRSLEASDDSGPIRQTFVHGSLLEQAIRVEVRLDNASDASRHVTLRAWLNDAPSHDEILERYRSEVAAADAAIGELIQGLKQRDLWDDTLVVLTSDHGEALGEHGTVGHVINLYDELLHVPLVVRLPRDERDEGLNASRGGLVRHIDVVPTVLERLDISNLPGTTGTSLFEPIERLLIAETHPPEAPRTLFTARDETYKLIFDPAGDSFEMYRLGPDPLELDNVFSHQGQLRETWQLVLRRLGDEVKPSSARTSALQSKLSALGY